MLILRNKFNFRNLWWIQSNVGSQPNYFLSLRSIRTIMVLIVGTQHTYRRHTGFVHDKITVQLTTIVLLRLAPKWFPHNSNISVRWHCYRTWVYINKELHICCIFFTMEHCSVKNVGIELYVFTFTFMLSLPFIHSFLHVTPTSFYMLNVFIFLFVHFFDVNLSYN